MPSWKYSAACRLRRFPSARHTSFLYDHFTPGQLTRTAHFQHSEELMDPVSKSCFPIPDTDRLYPENGMDRHQAHVFRAQQGVLRLRHDRPPCPVRESIMQCGMLSMDSAEFPYVKTVIKSLPMPDSGIIADTGRIPASSAPATERSCHIVF